MHSLAVSPPFIAPLFLFLYRSRAGRSREEEREKSYKTPPEEDEIAEHSSLFYYFFPPPLFFFFKLWSNSGIAMWCDGNLTASVFPSQSKY